MLTIDTDEPLHDALQQRARNRGLSVPAMAREILNRALLDGREERPNGREPDGSAGGLPALNRWEREHAWRRANRELLQTRYVDQWVVLEGEEIVAYGEDAVQVVEDARAKGVAAPYVFYVQPPRPPGVVRIGL